MDLVGVSRVIPSGKMYRQIFDDEINLVRALGETRKKISQRKIPPLPGKIPLVRDVEACSGSGFLSHRQRVWVEGMPNDDHTENPVQYKETATLAFLKAQESENVIAAREVRGLAEAIVPEKKNSNVIDRISQRRKCHHEETLLTMQQELARIGKEMEPRFLEPGKLFLGKLLDSSKVIEALFQVLGDDTNLETFTIQDFEQLWNQVAQETLKRREWIQELDKALIKAEADRTEQIKALLCKYTKLLEDIAYHLSSDVHRFIHKEAMMINQALLANRRAIARLLINLMEDVLKRDVVHHCKMDKRIKVWKAFQKEKIVTGFREFMECERIQDPSSVKTELENMLKDQLIFAEKRRELLQSLCTLLPLKHSKAEINEWYESVVALNKRIDTHNVQCMMRIRLQYEKICQECLSKVQECKTKLMDMKICTESEADRTVNPSFFQMVGKLQSQFEQFVESMDYDLEQLAKHTDINCKHLYQYFQDALVLFDAHQQRLSHQENEFHTKLNDCRNKHESLNKLRGIHLDMAVDKLRIQSSDEKMKAQLEKVFAALDFIRTGYMAFHHDMLSRINLYPGLILHDLISYSAATSRYFYVRDIYKGKPFQDTVASTEDQGTGENAEDGEKAQEGATGSPEERKEERHVQLSAEEKGTAAESEQEDKPGGMEDLAAGEDESGTPGDRMSFVLESEEMEQSDEENSPPEESEGVHDADEPVGPPQLTKLSSMLQESTEDTRESFTTSSGNTYRVLQGSKKLKAKKSERFYIGKLDKDCLPPYVQPVYISEGFITNMRRQIRLQFFEHLEEWFTQTYSNACVIVATKKEEIGSELQLRLHLHEPRRGHVEKDIYQVRIAELRYHNERLARHCTGLVEALNKEKSAFIRLREDQNTVSRNFRLRIQEMENTFLVENSAEKLMTLSNNLHMELINHVEVMQLSLRSYRQYLEEALGKLRDANTDFLRACKLFADGGNFSSEEIEAFTKRLQKESGRIDFVEGLIMIDLEKIESTYLEQATEIINKFESRFHYLALDRVFMEKIQRFLTNVQVKIKTEVAKSNLQTQTLNSYLEKLISRIDACAHPNVDKESVTSEALYEFARFLVEELKKRSKYLNCLLGLDTVYSSMRDPVLQSSIVTAFRSESLMQESKRIVMGVECTAVMNPCRAGKPAFDDAAFSMIKHLIGYHRYRRMTETQQDKDSSPSSADEKAVAFHGTGLGKVTQIDTSPASNLPPPEKKSSSIGKGVTLSTSSIQKYAKITRIEKKNQIFGDKPKENDCDHFKGIIFNILWDNFDTIMNIAEDFYKKDKHAITRPDFLQETYDQCIDVLGQKLLTYLHQADKYHIACITEFRVQLKRFEKQLPHVTQLVVRRLLKDHEQLLMDSIERIRSELQDQLQKWDSGKDKNKNTLSPSLGHPDNIPQLDALCQEEEERQKEQIEGINFYTKELEACVIDCARKFISTLARSTERMLVELDDCLTIDDVQHGKIEVIREKTSILIRRKKAGLSLETEENKLIAERGSRSWPGLPQTVLEGLPNQIICKETASVTTLKTTLGHMAAIEERDAVYVKFKHLLEAEFAQIQEQKAAHLMKAQLWSNWWKKSVQKIRQLYATPSLSHFSFSPL